MPIIKNETYTNEMFHEVELEDFRFVDSHFVNCTFLYSSDYYLEAEYKNCKFTNCTFGELDMYMEMALLGLSNNKLPTRGTRPDCYLGEMADKDCIFDQCTFQNLNLHHSLSNYPKMYNTVYNYCIIDFKNDGKMSNQITGNTYINSIVTSLNEFHVYDLIEDGLSDFSYDTHWLTAPENFNIKRGNREYTPTRLSNLKNLSFLISEKDTFINSIQTFDKDKKFFYQDYSEFKNLPYHQLLLTYTPAAYYTNIGIGGIQAVLIEVLYEIRKDNKVLNLKKFEKPEYAKTDITFDNCIISFKERRFWDNGILSNIGFINCNLALEDNEPWNYFGRCDFNNSTFELKTAWFVFNRCNFAFVDFTESSDFGIQFFSYSYLEYEDMTLYLLVTFESCDLRGVDLSKVKNTGNLVLEDCFLNVETRLPDNCTIKYTNSEEEVITLTDPNLVYLFNVYHDRFMAFKNALEFKKADEIRKEFEVFYEESFYRDWKYVNNTTAYNTLLSKYTII